jgi:DNA gyrase/topoisomerase IV subunit A
MVFSSKAKMYRLIVDNIPEGTNASKGVPIHSLINMETGEKSMAYASLYHGTSAKYVFFATKNGIIKKSWRVDYKNVKKLCKVKAEDSLEWAFCCDDEDLLVIRYGDKAKVFPVKDLKVMGKLTMGNKLLAGLIPDDAFVVEPNGMFYTVNDKGQTKVSLVSELSESWVNITPNTKLCGVVRDNMFYQDGNKYKEIKWSEYTPKGKTSVGAILGKEINILN